MNAVVTILVYFALLIYDTLVSSVLCFVPKRFKRKKDITGKTVLITGAGSGVGRNLAIEFSKHSTSLILVDINKKSLLETEKLLEGRSPVFIYECDVSDYKEVYQMAKKVKSEAGDVDILVNNAGVVSGHDLTSLSEENVMKTFGVNVLAHFWMCKAFLPPMMEKNEGHIVSIVSIAGKKGGPRLTDYCSSKFAAAGFADSLELELRQKKLDGIKITIVYPTIISTGMFAGAKVMTGGILTPGYVAKEVVDGVLEEKDSIALPWYFKFMFMMNELSPRWVNNKILELTGDVKVMDGFTGRIENGKTQ